MAKIWLEVKHKKLYLSYPKDMQRITIQCFFIDGIDRVRTDFLFPIVYLELMLMQSLSQWLEIYWVTVIFLGRTELREEVLLVSLAASNTESHS